MQGELCIIMAHKGNANMNWDKIEQLLHIGSMTTEHGPKYAPIAAAAQLELEQHLADAVKAIEEKKKADIAAAQKVEAEAEKAATAEADKAEAAARAKANPGPAPQPALNEGPIAPYKGGTKRDSEFNRV